MYKNFTLSVQRFNSHLNIIVFLGLKMKLYTVTKKMSVKLASEANGDTLIENFARNQNFEGMRPLERISFGV